MRHLKMFRFHIFRYSDLHSSHDTDFRSIYLISCFNFDSLGQSGSLASENTDLEKKMTYVGKIRLTIREVLPVTGTS